MASHARPLRVAEGTTTTTMICPNWCDRTYPHTVHQGVLATIWAADPWRENRPRQIQLVRKGRFDPVLGLTILEPDGSQLSAVPTWDQWREFRDTVNKILDGAGDDYEARFPPFTETEPGGTLARSLGKFLEDG